jgi:hypothetical protein
MAKTITAATAEFKIAIAGLFTTPQTVDGFAADEAFLIDSVESAQVVVGVDANMSVGWIPNAKKQHVMIMPDSDALDMFNTWGVTQEGTKEVFIAQATIYIPAINYKYTLVKGVLTNWKPIPDVKKVLQAVPYEITWQSILGASMGGN